MTTTNILFYKELTSGWKVGEALTPETIRQGTVRMEKHPDYEAVIQKAKDAGFEVRFSGEASVKWTELYDLDQNFIRIEKILNVAAGMRYIDLEHELGHIEQFTTRFGDQVPPLEKKIPLRRYYRRDVDVLAGIMTEKQKIIVEYHNRLVEFLRLYDRGVDVKILKEHAHGPYLDGKDGLDYWKNRYERKAINQGMSISRSRWIEKYFPELLELEKRYKQCTQTIDAGQYTLHLQYAEPKNGGN
jgi:hypothetical protein